MSFKEYTDFANETGTCYLATVDGDQPRVRAMGMCFADETGFYFNTESPKSLYKQLEQNKKVEIIYHSMKPGPNAGKVMRLSGEIEFVDDKAIMTRIFDSRPFLKGLGVKSAEDPMLSVFKLSKGEAYFWTMADNMKEDQLKKEKFDV